MMKKLSLSVTLVSILLFACNDKAEIPSDVLSKDRMTLILTDIGQVEAQIQSSGLERNDSTKKVAYGYYKSIFQKHKITPEQFRKSFDFYTAHLEMMDAMYDTVIVNLSRREAEEAGR